jgi:predicted permease
MRTLVQDFRYAIRMLVGKPGFTAAAVAVLALGIGANTAIFSLVNAFFLRPLMLGDSAALTGCYSRDAGKPDSYRAFSYPNYADVRDNNPVFASLTAHSLAMVGLSEGDSTRRMFADLVSSNFFTTLGVPLYRGRTFTAAEERPGSGVQVVIVSYPFWRKHGSDPEMLGRTLRVNGRIFTIVGVTPEGFTGTTALISPELYLPLGVFESMMNDFDGHTRPLAARDNHVLMLVGRLRRGMGPAAADAQLAMVASRMQNAYPAENKDQTLVVRPLSRMSLSTRPTSDSILMAPAAMLLSVAAVVLLIASLNVANMMLARGAARRKEIAIRLALGGSRGRILQQLFTEGLVLALAGGAAGLLVAYNGTAALVHSLSALAPFDLIYNAGPDARVLIATLAFCTFSTLLFAFGPAWSLSKPDIVPGLKESSLDADWRGQRRLFSRRNLLVVSQISLSLMLLTAAGLFVRSAQRAARVEPGFRIENGLLLEVDPSLAGYDEAHGRQIYRQLLDRVKSIPGVESASIAAAVPFGVVSLGRDIQRSSDAPEASRVACTFNVVGEDYFKTLAIPVLRGRSFQAVETQKVAILDRKAAESLWPKGDAIGQHIRLFNGGGDRNGQDAQVIGIVGVTQDNIIGPASQPHVYAPFGQEYQADMNIHVKNASSSREADSKLLEAIRQEVRSVDGQLPVLALKTLRDHVDASIDIWVVRTGASMFSIFGGVALLLAMIGLYGVRAYTVARRTREIGIRMALGADSSDALRMILREGLLLTAIGVGGGLALSLAAGKVLSSQLYSVSAMDPSVFLAAPMLLAGISLLACYLPARRAARVDPMVALREE